MGAANNIRVFYSDVLRKAGNQQTDNGLLYIPPTIKITSPPDILQKTTAIYWREGVWLRSWDLHNRSGGAANVGIGGRLNNRWWIAGRLSADGATYTDTTANTQSSTLTTTLGVDGADQTGFVILSRMPFDWVSAYVTTAETNAGGGTVVDHTVQYSVGSTWQTLAANQSYTDDFTTTNAVWSAGVHNFVWQRPYDWKLTAGNSGTPDGYYGLRFTAADREAGDVAAIITGLEIGPMISVEGVPDNGIWGDDVIDFWMPGVDGVVAYFSTANAGNRVYGEALTR
jgi:hypothetical protein